MTRYTSLSSSSQALLLALFIAGCSAAPPATDITLPALFTDHMVVQRDAPITIWGWASPNGTVSVSIADQRKSTRVNGDNTWRLELSPMRDGGPHTLTISGADTLSLTDVLVGEVWVASGQSNMEWPVQASNDAEAEMQAASFPNIRIFKVARTVAYSPQTQVEAEGWNAVTPETVPEFSAVAYFFGRRLHKDINVPIGLIETAWGGTPAEAWTSGAALNAAMTDFAGDIAEMTGGEDGEPMTYEAQMQAWHLAMRDQDRGYRSGQPAWAASDFDDSDWPEMQAPQLWEGAGLPGYDGVVWMRKSFELPPTWRGNDVELHLANIDDIDTTWVNGVHVGHTAQYNLHRAYNVSGSVLTAGRNVIAVRVLDTGGGGGIWGEPDDLFLAGDGMRQSLASTWSYQPAVEPGTDAALPPLRAQNRPTTLYNAMVAPLIPYTIRGAIWYQGESNAGRAYQYRSLFSTMIQDWRNRWGIGDFPFFFVQLANFMAPQQNPSESETWPELREAQSMALDLPNTAQAVIIDIGEADDIHPRNKRDVGTRLALAALGVAYDRDVVYSGPTYREMSKEGGNIRLQFDHVGSGLMSTGGDTLDGFAIAGSDSTFVWADARIDGETIVVSSPAVADPVAVRYAWANNPVISLYNQDGLPASPFRTDDWPGITGGD